MTSDGPGAALRRSADEPEAFGLTYDALAGQILRYFTLRVGDPETGMDLMAETFAQAFLSRGSFRGSSDGEAAAWVFRIAKRQLAGYLKRGKLEQTALRRLRLEAPVLEAHEAARVAELSGLDELRIVLTDELARLPKDQSEAVRLRVIDELSYGNVAAKLNTTEATARARVSRALRRIADRVEARHGQGGLK